ncbi:MAG: hypothetical protein QOE56_778 [Solirubrobacterales bacterium]|nr:hypothetical protein [Solirubrobacterales bacterium]
MTDSLKITPTESVEIVSSTPQGLEVEATYGTGKPPPKHFHVFRLAGPDLLLRPALAGLAVIGRARGYSA